MKISKYLLLMPLALFAIAASGCGGGGGSSSVPADSVAVVGGQKITTAQYDTLINQAKTGYARQHRKFPSPGSQEYAQLRSQAVQFLVQKAEFEQAAKKMGITITDAQIDHGLDQLKKQYFSGNEKRYKQQLKAQGFTDAQVRDNVRQKILSTKLYNRVTGDVKVSDGDITSYYKQHISQYRTPQSRIVRHILVKSKPLADRIYNQLQHGASFAALAKKYSQDPGSKAQGGKLTVAKGQTVAQFDRVAFTLAKGKISRPVKTQYGWHVIQPLGAIKPAHMTPLSQVRASIRQTLVQQRKSTEFNGWLKKLQKDFDVRYQTGYEPTSSQPAGQ